MFPSRVNHQSHKKFLRFTCKILSGITQNMSRICEVIVELYHTQHKATLVKAFQAMDHFCGKSPATVIMGNKWRLFQQECNNCPCLHLFTTFMVYGPWVLPTLHKQCMVFNLRTIILIHMMTPNTRTICFKCTFLHAQGFLSIHLATCNWSCGDMWCCIY